MSRIFLKFFIFFKLTTSFEFILILNPANVNKIFYFLEKANYL